MRKLIALTLLAAVVATGACSRAKDHSAEPTPRPDLRADAERLQNAINKAAEQRKLQSSPSPTASAPQ